MRITIRHKILTVVFSLSLLTLIAITSIYYYMFVRDIRELSQHQIDIAFEMLFDDITKKSRSSLPQINRLIDESIAGYMHIIDSTKARYSNLEDESELEKWRHIQELVSRYNRIAGVVGDFSELLNITGFVIYDKDHTLMTAFGKISDKEYLGAYLGDLKGGTFVPLLTPEEKFSSLTNVQAISKQRVPEGVAIRYAGEPPKATDVFLSADEENVSIKFLIPIYHLKQYLGVCIINMGIQREDIQHYSRFTKTEINLFSGSKLVLGMIPDYRSIDPESTPKARRIDLLDVGGPPDNEHATIVVNDNSYYQGRLQYVDPFTSRQGTITANFPRLIEQEKVDELIAVMAVITSILIFIIVFVSAYLSKRIVHPINALEESVKDFSEENLSLNAPVLSTDEVGTLAVAFNKMAVQLNERFSQVKSQIKEIQQEVEQRKAAQNSLQKLNEELDNRVEERTEELQIAKKKAETVNQAKSLFLANMSHELRTPLNAILGFSQMMAGDKDLNSQQKGNLEIINRSGHHLLQLINDVLDMSKIESGKTRLDIDVVDLGALIHDTFDMMRIRAEQKGLQLQLDKVSDFPRFVHADGPKIRQILINLLSNAIKFTDSGSVTLYLESKSGDSDRITLYGKVMDTGRGIDRQDLESIFHPFEQLVDATEQKGTGLGLSITRQFVELMGGEITGASKAKEGSTFSFHIVVTSVSPEEISTVIEREKLQVIGLEESEQKRRILVVEDQLDSQLLARQILERVGFQVQIVEDGEKAIQAFQAWRPHFIWMDWRMPRMDGREATRRIRELPGGREVKIAVLTASALNQQKSEVMKSEVDDYVSKPYCPEEFLNCMARHLKLRYKYAENENEVKPVYTSPLTTMTLEVLPDQFLTDLQEAADVADKREALLLIDSLADEYAELGTTLVSLVEDYNFDQLLELIEMATKQKKESEVHS
ncbi:MAG: response regulator [Candidatus Thiodiazotropha sp. (ex Lucinoma kastoroae)]|nr:response regulator [Candidatus Thiodiazotropha sp. (ex Lucinoma kastoroae)]